MSPSPYSGHNAHDGHPDHATAWTADAYYGYITKNGWTEQNGKFDQSYLKSVEGTPATAVVNRVPDYAVGRVDFARMPTFAMSVGLPAAELQGIEVALLRRYLAKDLKYRANGVPTFGRVSAYLGNGAVGAAANSAQTFAGAAFGTEPGRVFHGYNLCQKVPADLGVHFRFAGANGDDGVDNGVSDGMDTVFTSDNFANAAMEVPVTFRHVWFSYACDWARLDSLNRFLIPNNFLRASLGWPNYGLATVGGQFWDFSPLGAGLPLAETMTRAWQSQTIIPAFESILGDPTLRLFRVTPPQNVRSSRPVTNGPVTLSWDPAAEQGTAYYVYRSGSNTGVDGFAATPNPLNAVRVQGTSFTDTAASGANLTYQVRATKLQTTGSGSFWNLSQGTFISVP